MEGKVINWNKVSRKGLILDESGNKYQVEFSGLSNTSYLVKGDKVVFETKLTNTDNLVAHEVFRDQA